MKAFAVLIPEPLHVCLMELYGFQAVLGPSSNIPTKYPTLEETLDNSAAVACSARAKWSE